MLHLSILSSLDIIGLVFQIPSSCGTSPISERLGCRLIVPVHLGYDGLSDGVCYHDPLDFDVGGEPTHLMEPYKVGARALMTPCQL